MPDSCTAVSPSDRQSLWTLAILSMLMAFASISTDLYLPALPAMADALHADAGQVELTISGYLIGFSLGQLLWGPIGDRHGRRLPIALGLMLFIIGSAGCALSGSAEAMIAWRAVQAVGACASVVLARAMVRDLYSGHRAAQMLSTQLNSRWVVRHGSDRLMRLGILGAVLSAVLLTVSAWTDWGGLAGLVIPLFLFVASTGFIVANSIVGAMGAFPEVAGATSALVGSLQYGTGILGSGLVGTLADGTPRPMAAVMLVFGVASLLCARWLVPSRQAGSGD
ncbi:MFS transporter [Pseudomonas vanderleydeniana]|uniref:MFS transporter n=1 Tax=Pseudomonas vanderleydeniana TaxID=2745495 RepID=A0A9E6PPE2_9PSED|nr:MFS transporter [Pseudomonas vanderleydeniana]QXI30564.1 MFS transporter [Pseudomonas vanderleydeniana]